MVSIDQVSDGLVKYIREYLVGQIPKDSWKYLAGNVGLDVIELSIKKNKNELKKKLEDKVLSKEWSMFVDIVTPDGMVDIDTIYKMAPRYISPQGFLIHIPMIGDYTILPTDIDILYNCITAQSNALGGGVR